MDENYIVSNSILKKYELEFKAILKDQKNAKRIIQGIFDFSKNKCMSNSDKQYLDSIFTDRCKNLLNDLNNNNNITAKEILKKINNDELDAYSIAFFTPVDMDSKNWEKIVRRIQTSENKLTDLPTVEWKPCKICKGKNYFYRTEQTRSADEPETVFYTCKTCERVYKFNN